MEPARRPAGRHRAVRAPGAPSTQRLPSGRDLWVVATTRWFRSAASAVQRPDLIRRDYTIDPAHAAGYPLVRRHHLDPDLARLALPGHRDRPGITPGRRLGFRR